MNKADIALNPLRFGISSRAIAARQLCEMTCGKRFVPGDGRGQRQFEAGVLLGFSLRAPACQTDRIPKTIYAAAQRDDLPVLIGAQSPSHRIGQTLPRRTRRRNSRHFIGSMAKVFIAGMRGVAAKETGGPQAAFPVRLGRIAKRAGFRLCSREAKAPAGPTFPELLQILQPRGFGVAAPCGQHAFGFVHEAIYHHLGTRRILADCHIERSRCAALAITKSDRRGAKACFAVMP